MGALETRLFGFLISFSALGDLVASFFRYLIHFGRIWMLLVPSWRGWVGGLRCRLPWGWCSHLASQTARKQPNHRIQSPS